MYNGGNGGRVTLNQAWETLQKIAGVRIDPVYGPPRPGMCAIRRPIRRWRWRR